MTRGGQPQCAKFAENSRLAYLYDGYRLKGKSVGPAFFTCSDRESVALVRIGALITIMTNWSPLRNKGRKWQRLTLKMVIYTHLR